ncbi:MAG: hypothetical protein E5W94_10220 [Mesorhizobium sp.]|nr:MAG: hypothetical protein E5W94_10220 [Mesorhizobium sp.]
MACARPASHDGVDAASRLPFRRERLAYWPRAKAGRQTLNVEEEPSSLQTRFATRIIRNWSFDLSARFLNIIGAATSAGAYSPGQEQAPAAFRRHGLAEALASRGRTIRDHGDVASFRWRPDPSQPQAMNLEAVRHACDVVASHVATAIAAQEDVLVLGGDCTCGAGNGRRSERGRCTDRARLHGFRRRSQHT